MGVGLGAVVSGARCMPQPIQCGGVVKSAGSSALPPGAPYMIWSVGGSVLAPLFTGGRLRAQADASGSRRDQALIAYERAVLSAFAEVEAQLDAYGRLHEQTAQALEQRRATAESLRVSHRRFEQGHHHLPQRGLHHRRDVVGNFISNCVGEKLREFLHLAAHGVGGG